MGLIARLRNLLRTGHHTADIDRELAFHLEERVDDLVAHGMAPDVARREARRRFGHVASQREHTRDAGVATWADSLLGDLRYAARSLRHSRIFALVAITSIALGIGANTAIFSLINAVMLRELPVRDPQQLYTLGMSTEDDSPGEFTNPLWEQVRDGQHPFADVFAYADFGVNLAESGEERIARGLWVSGSFFPVLGVTADRGRLLTAADDVPGCPAVAVIGHAFWQSTLGADPSIVGRTISFGGRAVEVIGVASRQFHGLETGRNPAFFVPLCAQPVLDPASGFLQHRSYWFLRIIGRLAPDRSLQEAVTALQQMSPQWFTNTLPADWSAENKTGYLSNSIRASSSLALLSAVRGSYQQALWVLMGIVSLVLLVACANVANLMLVRAETRQREFAVRVALGAGRGRVVRQLFTEGLLLAIVGAVVGLGLARVGSLALVRVLISDSDPMWLDLSVDGRVLVFTAVVAVATAVIFASVPAWRAGGAHPHDAIKEQGRGAASRSRFSIARVLVALQVALCLMLVTGAGLLLGSFRAVSQVDKGFDPAGVLMAETDFRWRKTAPDARVAMQRQVLERLRTTPGVARASAAFITPLERRAWMDQVGVPGSTLAGPDRRILVSLAWDDYFATMGMRLLRGRDYNATDVAGGTDVGILNETAAKRFFPTGDAVGQTVTMERGDGTARVISIVGVASDVRSRSLREPASPHVFLAMAQDREFNTSVTFVIKAADPSVDLRATFMGVMREIAPTASMSFRSLEVQVNDTVRGDLLLASLSIVFGLLALLLAMIGLYGTIAYTVARRRGEIGIRMALGAAPSRVSRGIIGEVGVIVAAGLCLGLAGALASTGLLGSLLFGLSPRDPIVIGGAALALAAVSFAAGYLPARRAARTDPMETLRSG